MDEGAAPVSAAFQLDTLISALLQGGLISLCLSVFLERLFMKCCASGSESVSVVLVVVTSQTAPQKNKTDHHHAAAIASLPDAQLLTE